MSERYSYLTHLLGWALPVIAGQSYLLSRIYKGRVAALARLCAGPVLLVSAWLTFGDHFAIGDGIWRFGEEKIMGLYLGRVPVDEVLFFFLTNVLVAQGVALFAYRAPRKV